MKPPVSPTFATDSSVVLPLVENVAATMILVSFCILVRVTGHIPVYSWCCTGTVGTFAMCVRNVRFNMYVSKCQVRIKNAMVANPTPNDAMTMRGGLQIMPDHHAERFFRNVFVPLSLVASGPSPSDLNHWSQTNPGM
jgi:hypothetical protein